MHAIRLHAFGPAENLRYEEVLDPEPGPGQVRIAVAAAGVHLVDTTIRSGEARGPFPLPDLPAVPGREVAGAVDAVGDGVDPSWIGRRVVAHLGIASGGYAELALCAVESLHVLADGVDPAAAVAMIGTGRTTLAILEVAAIQPDDVVVITSAAGGIGTLAVQAALSSGASVVALAGGAEKVERVRALGAHVAVDYDRPDWVATVREVLGDRTGTVALDGVGGAAGRGAFELLGPGGRLVLFGWSSGKPVSFEVTELFERSLSVSAAIGPRIFQRPGGMRSLEIAALAALAEGRLVPVVGPPFRLADAAAAHRAMETRATYGKTVLIP
jgi:NADPH2:quinone reductase